MIRHDFYHYLQYERRYSAHTVEAYSTDVEQFFRFYEISDNAAFLKAFQSRSIRKYIQTLLERGMTPRSIRRKISSLRLMGDFLVYSALLTKNPVERIHLPKATLPLTPFVDMNDLAEFIASLPTPESFSEYRDTLILLAFYHTGIRLSELINLEIGQIDFSEKVLRVKGKRNKERIIPMNKELEELIISYRIKRTELFQSDSGYLILTNKGVKAYPKLMYNCIHNYLDKFSSISQKSPHVLRHSFATHLLNNGAELNVIKELLGHASLAATQVYTHTDIDKLKKAYKQAHPRA